MMLSISSSALEEKQLAEVLRVYAVLMSEEEELAETSSGGGGSAHGPRDQAEHGGILPESESGIPSEDAADDPVARRLAEI